MNAKTMFEFFDNSFYYQSLDNVDLKLSNVEFLMAAAAFGKKDIIEFMGDIENNDDYRNKFEIFAKDYVEKIESIIELVDGSDFHDPEC